MSNKNSGYFVTLTGFVPFDPTNMEDVTKKAASLGAIQQGQPVTDATIALFNQSVVKSVRFMQQVPKSMLDDEPEQEETEQAEVKAKK